MNHYDKHPNAQRWTAELVTTHLRVLQMEASTGESLFLGIALSKQGLYRHVWAYWKKIFHDNEDIIEMMLHIETTFESKLLDGALRKKLSGWVAMMALKNTYNWHDKPRHSDSLLSSGGQ